MSNRLMQYQLNKNIFKLLQNKITKKMKKASNYKALYKFAKKQKTKDATSTKDVDDSLDLIDIKHTKNIMPIIYKNVHQRTQSCPSIPQPLKFIKPDKLKNKQSNKQPQQKTIRSFATAHPNKSKLAHQYSGSLISNQSSSIHCQTISIDLLSSVLYHKHNKDNKLLKKICSPASLLIKKNFVIKNQHYCKAKIQQQIKVYELTEQLKIVERKSTGITIKQQILQDLLKKYEYDFAMQEYIEN